MKMSVLLKSNHGALLTKLDRIIRRSAAIGGWQIEINVFRGHDLGPLRYTRFFGAADVVIMDTLLLQHLPLLTH